MKLRSSLISLFISISLLFIPTLSIAGKKQKKIYRTPQTKSKIPKKIFQHPNKHSQVIVKLPIKTRWIIRLPGLKKYSRSTWLHVSWKNKRGWMEQKHLVFDSQATDIAAKKPECLNPNRSKSCDH